MTAAGTIVSAPAARVAERRPERAAARDPSAANASAERPEAVDVEQRDVEVRVEQDRDRVEDAAARRGDADAARARPATTWALVTT